MRTRIQNATIVNEGKRFVGTVTLEDDKILSIVPSDDTIHTLPPTDRVIDAEGLYLIPGVIDDHVHFREPGLTHKADIATESRAAAAGGVTSYMDMPNVVPQTTTLEALDDKFQLAAEKSLVNYSFFFGATHDEHRHAGTTGPAQGMWRQTVHGKQHGQYARRPRRRSTRHIQPSPLLIMTHCEDSSIISANLKSFRERYGDDPDVKYHPAHGNEEACFRSTELAVRLARETGARLHVAHVSTARELSLFRRDPLWDETTGRMKPVTAEACIAHLFYTDADYARLGTRIKCNPAIKSGADRAALRQALTDGRIDVIGTDPCSPPAC